MANYLGRDCLLAFLLLFSLTANAADPKQSGKDLGASALSKYGNKDALKSGLINPIISSDTQLSTLDGSKSFNAQLVCPSSKKFLEILVQPSGSGDITTLVVSEDTDMDGTFDYAYQVPFPVSGICANGVVSCDTGTWNNCTHYKWDTDPNTAKVLLSESSVDILGGCYCINSSCGSSLVWNNLGIVLKDLGGGVAGAIQRGNVKFTISDAKIDNTTIAYYGQQTGNCSYASSPAGSGTSAPEQYYSNPSQLSGDARTTMVSQSANPSSYYNLIKNSLAMQQNMADVNTCKVDRVDLCIADSTDYTESINDLCGTLDNDPKCKLKNETVDGATIYQNYNPTGLVPEPVCRDLTCQKQATCNNDMVSDSGAISEPSCIAEGMVQQSGIIGSGVTFACGGSGALCDFTKSTCSVSGVSGTFGCTGWDPVTNACTSGTCLMKSPCLPNQQPSTINCLSVDNNGYCVSGSCLLTTPTTSYTTYVPAGNAVTGTAHQHIMGDCGCYGYYYIGIYDALGSLVAYINNNSSLGCGDFTSPLVYQATQAGNYTVKIWMNNHAYCGASNCTGTVNQIRCPLDPALSCSGSVQGSSICVQAITHHICDWRHKERAYLCDTGQKYDFTDAQKRLQAINSSTHDNTSSFYYKDLRKDDNGNWFNEDVTTHLGGREVYGDCEQACKVQKGKTDTQASETGNTSQYRVSTQSNTFLYKVCTAGSCPADADEQIVKDCQCINEFAEAASIMQSLRTAGQDMVCSSGKGKPLQ